MDRRAGFSTRREPLCQIALYFNAPAVVGQRNFGGVLGNVKWR